MRGQIPRDSPIEVEGDCKNVRLALDFLAGRPLRQTCLLAPVLIWIGKGRTGEAGRKEGLPLEQLNIPPV